MKRLIAVLIAAILVVPLYASAAGDVVVQWTEPQDMAGVTAFEIHIGITTDYTAVRTVTDTSLRAYLITGLADGPRCFGVATVRNGTAESVHGDFCFELGREKTVVPVITLP